MPYSVVLFQPLVIASGRHCDFGGLFVPTEAGGGSPVGVKPQPCIAPVVACASSSLIVCNSYLSSVLRFTMNLQHKFIYK